MFGASPSQISRTILVLVAICLFVLPAYAKYSGGTGEPNDPYQIATAVDLIALGETPEDYDKHFVLTADIDLDPNLPGRKVFDKAVIAPDVNDPNGWSGFDRTGFTGVFDGNGHTISHLTIVVGKDHVGLFGQLGSIGWPGGGGEVKNLGVVDVNIAGSGDGVGGLVGYNLGTVTGCYSSGAVSGNGFVGGLVGFNYLYGTIVTSYAIASVSGTGWYVGGLVGYNDGCVIHCYSTGMVIGGLYPGGLAGEDWGDVVNCFWDIQTSGQAKSYGGTGKTTDELQTAAIFLSAGWDFVGETTNGTEDIWWIDEGKDYPRLWWELIPEN